MRVAFVAQWRQPGALSVSTGIAHSLARSGAEVTSLSGRFGLDGTRHGPRRGLRHAYSWAGGQVITYPSFYSHGSSATGRMLSYGSYALSGAIAASDLKNHDVALVYATPATTAAQAIAANLRFGLPYVMLVQDVWPDSIFATGFLTRGPVRRIAEDATGRFVDLAYRRASAVVAISPGMRDLLVSRGVPPDKAHYVYNWVSGDSAIEPIQIAPRLPGQPLHLMYAGAIGLAQNLDNVLDALSLLPPGVARLSLVGDGPATADLRRQASDLGLTNVSFVGRVARERVPALQETAHLHLISLADQDLFRITLPSKLQALAVHGAPVICTAPGEASDLVAAHRMGITAPPGDPQALAEAILSASSLTQADLQTMGAKGRALYTGAMSQSQGAPRLLRILKEAAATKRGKRGKNR